QQALDQLPQPDHQYTLCLKKGTSEKGDDLRQIDVWALCHRVCRVSDAAATEDATLPITADRSLIDEDLNDVDWIRLDEKAKRLVEDAFAQL
ncbi:MAG: hypothetical protein AAFZ80_04320, partial [Cyanobacteria bacterium P01_A01_bin.105]